MSLTRFVLAASLLVVSCASEPPFIQACEAECACTSESFACREPYSGGCDNSYRRSWVLMQQKSADCTAKFEAYFNCLYTRSVCSGGDWKPPNGACDSVEAPYRDCQ